jgi:1-acyl-sn-glycerol-3-phosphate acyltransferase
LAAGEPVAVFPEGTRRNGREVNDLFDGTAYLAVKLGVPILPVGIGGSEEILASGKKLPRLRRVAVVVGPPIFPPPDATTRKRSDLAAITAELQVELQQLFDAAMAIVDR